MIFRLKTLNFPINFKVPDEIFSSSLGYLIQQYVLMSGRLKPVGPVSEENLVLALQSGDEPALRSLYRLHYPMVVQMVINNGGTLQEGKDIFQETLIIFYEKLKDESFQLNCQVKTYLYSVSRRLWLKQLERKSRHTNVLNDTHEYIELNHEEIGKQEDQYTSMHRALESIGEPCRSILKDFYLENQSMDTITRKFGYTNSDNAKTQKYKCLQRLKKQFFEYYKSNREQ